MNRFAELLDALLFTPSRNGKLRLMQEYFAKTPDAERSWALAALTGELSFAEAKPSQVRDLAMARVDPELFGWSWDLSTTYGGDNDGIGMENSANTGLYAAQGYTPSSFHLGTVSNTQLTNNLDFSRAFQLPAPSRRSHRERQGRRQRQRRFAQSQLPWAASCDEIGRASCRERV